MYSKTSCLFWESKTKKPSSSEEDENKQKKGGERVEDKLVALSWRTKREPSPDGLGWVGQSGVGDSG